MGVGVAVLLLSGLLLWTVVMDCLVLLQISLKIDNSIAFILTLNSRSYLCSESSIAIWTFEGSLFCVGTHSFIQKAQGDGSLEVPPLMC